MKTRYRKWTSFVLVLSMLMTLIPAMSAYAATSRITITGYYTSDAQPDLSNSMVPRVTSAQITIPATIENISDNQVQSLYYEVTNVTVAASPVRDTTNKAVKTGQFDIQFKNVRLTEGLNKIVVKLGDTSVVASAPAWVYYTPTTNLETLTINGVTFEDNKLYPDNPMQSTIVNIAGTAPNATEVKAFLEGDPAPKNAFFSNGDFFFLADDINKPVSTAAFRLKPGDNPMTIVAVNNSKTFQVQKNLIYDNGKPFAFNAKIGELDTNGAPSQLDTSGNPIKHDLIRTPMITTPKAEISAYLKDDLTALGDLQYKFVEVMVGGQRFGPYNLDGANAAPKVFSVYPSVIYQGYTATDMFISGEALSTNSKLTLTGKDGIPVDLDANASITVGTPIAVNTAKTVAAYRLPTGSLTAANSPYSIVITDGGRTIHDTAYSLGVNIPTGNLTLPSVSSFAGIPDPGTDLTKAGTPWAPGADERAFEFSAGTPNQYALQITDAQNRSVASVVGTAGTLGAVNFKIPVIQTEGLYKYKLTYDGMAISERAFTVGRKDPAAPDVQISGPIVLKDADAIAGFGGLTNPTTLSFSGVNLGVNKSDYTSARLIDQANPATNIPITVTDVRDTSILFTIPNQSALQTGVNYTLAFTKQLRYPDGTLGSTYPYTGPLTVAGAVYASPTIGTTAVTGITVPQLIPSEIGSTSLTVDGVGLMDRTLLALVVMNEDGTNPRNANVLATIPAGTQATADFTSIPGLIAGHYLIRVIYNNEILGQFPFVVADPVASSISENGSNVVVAGNNLGRNLNLLKLRFAPVDNPDQFVEQTASSIDAGRNATFVRPPGLANGAYMLTFLYNDVVVGNPFPYNVSAAATSLNEVASWSRPGRYKVFDFSAKLDIPTDKVQVVEFRFYNSSSDNNPPTTFTFNYVDPNLPYIEQVKRSDGMILTEGGRNDITELPTTLSIITDNKTNKVNVYLGNYTTNTGISTTLNNPDTMSLQSSGKYIFTYAIPDNIANGITPITFIPSTDNVTNTKTGENYSGRRQYDLTVSNTPYLIINNIYSGRVVKNPNLEVTCIRPSETLPTGNCISGRLVNIPLPFGSPNPYTVEVIVNDSNTNTLVPDPTFKTFYVQVANFKEGKNTIKFNVKKGGAIVTSSSYDLFVFSTEAPEFLSIKPIERTDIIKFVKGTQPETYSTSETSVAFSGQFANATEIKLTKRTKDDNGAPIVIYDRRYNNFSSAEPQSANPNYFRLLNSPTIGQFETVPITLAPKGETIFEFSIANASGINVTRTITISREPLPFVVKYPVLITNEKGELQANINSNYVEIELDAEGADSVMFGKEMAVQREIFDENGIKRKRFFYELNDLKVGKNTVKFVVNRGTNKSNGGFIVYNVDTPVEGAQFKTALKTSMTAFDGQIKLTLPRGTNFMRNEAGAVNPFLSADRKILFGIANQKDGRVDKWKHPTATDGQVGNRNPLVITTTGQQVLSEPTGKFRPASPLFWIDAGSIRKNETDMNQALSGSGRLPYDNDTFYARSKEDQVVPTDRGTLTLKYDSIIRNDAWKYVTVYHFDIYEDYTGTTQWRWKNLGGVVNTNDNTVTVPFETFGYYQVMYMGNSYDDVTGHPWARNELDTLYAKGLMLNKEASAFVPNDAITRGEFATMLVKIFDIPLQYTDIPTFTDVPRVNILTRLYDYKYVETAARAGIVRGAALGRFLPDSAVTRQDAAVMIARAADLKLSSDSDLNKVLANLQKQFTDGEQIDIYARTAVEAVAKAGLIEGKENVLQQGQSKATVRFDPLNTFTRAEAAVVAIRVLKQQKKIPK
ncbi:S-layer homology domain-containing protein [Paenibacillus koleovorans]|uniref:S-layer homology domain-containing protein n=1 Tax=Paenibacillus koleovorans TaxID=121608 RepID=UPI000FD7E4CD|nr:S-layer homology domain-containing protein [Paenibacillus koleovorans]